MLKINFTLNLLTSVFVSLTIVDCIEFDRNYVGVNFSPYVKSGAITGQSTGSGCPNEISRNELKTMLQVVSTKFSRISTESVGTWRGSHFNLKCAIGKTAEVAAMLNAENNNKILSVLIGITPHYGEPGRRSSRATWTEVSAALEAEEVANGIFPGTVEGLQLFVNASAIDDKELASFTLVWLNTIKEETKGKSLKIGVFTEVQDLTYFDIQRYNVIEHFDLHQPHVRLVLQSVFLNVKAISSERLLQDGPAKNFLYWSRPILSYGPLSTMIRPEFKVMAITGWPSQGNHSLQSLENMEAYWNKFNEFASKHNYTIWLNEAFDNPWKQNLDRDLSHYGWWRLADDKLAHDPSAYMEKILEGKENKWKQENETIPNLPAWIGAGLTAVAFITILLVGLMVQFYRKINSLKQILTYDEIKEFQYGITDNDIKNEEHGRYVTAMRKPYDQSLEIPKEQLEIYWDKFLGAGEFGSVYKALITGPPAKEVALKTTKAGCTSIALKGLLSEIKILTHLGQHTNIVSICGAYTTELGKGKLYVALELCTMGSLKRHLEMMQMRKITNEIGESEELRILDDLLRWSYEIAAGMEHIGNKGVIHADLAARNVLLTNESTAKIADFGLSRRLYEQSEYVKKGAEPLPWRWMAIEALKMRQFSYQSDVWSFGVTLWEIFSLGAEPYAGYSFNDSFIENLEKGLATMSRPSLATDEIFQLMRDCWNLKPDLRPTFTGLRTQILETLEAELNQTIGLTD